MPSKRSRNKQRALRRGRKHALSTSVVSSRIVLMTFLRQTKHFLIYTTVTCLLIFLCWGMFHSARKLVLEGDRFQLDSIRITPEPTALSFFSYQNLPQVTGLEVNDSIFEHSLGAIKTRLEEYPEVLEATLIRHFPGEIEITLKERPVLAFLRYQDALYLVDGEGFCFSPNYPNDQLVATLPQIQTKLATDLPFDLEDKMIKIVGLQRALALCKQWAQNEKGKESLKLVQIIDQHSLRALTSGGSTLTFGYYEHERQIGDYQLIRDYAAKNKLRIETANLLPYKNIPVSFDKAPTPPKPAAKPTNRPQAPSQKSTVTPNREASDLMKILKQG